LGDATFGAAAVRVVAGAARVRFGTARVAPADSGISAMGGGVFVGGARRRGVTGPGVPESTPGSAAVLRLRGGGFGGTGSSMRRV